MDRCSMPMEGLQDAMGLVGAWHFGQHSADGVRVFLGWGQHGQMEKAAGRTKEQNVVGLLTGLPDNSSSH